MVNVIKKATNKFTKGLVMDFSPENTKNEVLTHALNATLLTFNGNELSLQNDMGNARVETAFLPDGYMPVGTCEYGGIVYIVSYNPLEDRSLIGCFPSPERNISNDELGEQDALVLVTSFQNGTTEGEIFKPDGSLKNTTQYVLLKNDNLNPGDKFMICSDKSIYQEALKDLYEKKDGENEFKLVDNPIIALNIVSIEDSGKITYLNSTIKQYEVSNSYSVKNPDTGLDIPKTDVYKYYILGDAGSNDTGFDQQAIDIDSYRNVLNSGFSVFRSKTSGKLALLVELITIDSFSVYHEIKTQRNSDNSTSGYFDVLLHTEVSPEVSSNNYLNVPKLKYYHLKHSQGHIQVGSGEDSGSSSSITMFKSGSYNPDFKGVMLSDIYIPTTKEKLKLNVSLDKTSKFNFPKPNTYHGRMLEESFDDYSTLISEGVKTFTKFLEGKYHRIDKSLVYDVNNDNILNYYLNDLNAKFYYFDKNNNQYTKEESVDLDIDKKYYIIQPEHTYHNAQRDLQYKNEDLYKLTSEPIQASDEVLADASIEKFIQRDKFSYTLAKESDFGTVTVYEKTTTELGDEYVKVNDPIPGNTYYIQTTLTYYESIGTGVVDRKDWEKYILVYYPNTKNYSIVLDENVLKEYWGDSPYSKTDSEPNYGYPDIFYYRKTEDSYKEATILDLENYNPDDSNLYYKSDYIKLDSEHFKTFGTGTLANLQLFITVPIDTYVVDNKFTPSTQYNWILNRDVPNNVDSYQEDTYPNEVSISIYTVANFLPDNSSDSDVLYNSVKLGNIKIPNVVINNGLSFPFKYDYTVVPCMNFGKLDHLAVSGTIDFSKLNDFNQSNYTTWKYHIDGNQLRLTFGTLVFDTYEENKVDALILEFYDLWGFAGSLEINNKKSYSGTFTKIIQLNALGALSKNRIVESQIHSTFKRNVNISESRDLDGNVIDNLFTYNGIQTVFQGDVLGWSGIDDANNDCGTIYSNLVYGVKTYLRRKSGVNSDSYEYIPKKLFFLYTLPIYNDFYYTINDFSSIINPKLDLVLTYKLEDNSNKELYKAESFTLGYDSKDYPTVAAYISGTLKETVDIELVKYYLYKGISRLYLEVGLKQDYGEYNLRYDPKINDLFKCTLQLLGEDSVDLPYAVKSIDSDVADMKYCLNYKDNTINSKLGFGDLHSPDKPIDKTTPYMFLNGVNEETIPIHYELVVGYKATIRDIRKTKTQTTTVCALCHENNDGEYNYTDFGVYKTGTEPNVKFLSNAMFYNGGTCDTEVFGVCRLVGDGSGTMVQQCSSYDIVETSAKDSKLPNKLNTDNPLRLMLKHIGKLTFCQPHAHSIREGEGVNIYNFEENGNLGISPYETDFTGAKYDDKNNNMVTDNSIGVVGINHLLNCPKYNLSLNTEDAILRQSEFISTIDYGTKYGKLYACDTTSKRWPKISDDNFTMRAYTGFTWSDVADFNKKMVETLKSVYAYNPDYDSIEVNSGSVLFLDREVKFVSNLISSNATLDLNGKSFNDYIYFGSISASNYFTYMQTYSSATLNQKLITTKDSVFLELLTFTPGLEYCGGNELKYLLTSLTYNTPLPEDAYTDLEFNSSDLLIIRHHDKEVQLLNGSVNKKRLYGFDKNLNKLVELDVSNYSINRDTGVLSLKLNTYENKTESVVKVDKTTNYSEFNSAKFYKVTKPNVCFIGTSLTINDLVYDGTSTGHRLFVRAKCYSNENTIRNIIYYRKLCVNDKDWQTYWGLSKQHKNHLYLQTGPCFTKNQI